MGDTAECAQEVALRPGLVPSDRTAIHEILKTTGFFSQAEITVALELIDDGLQKHEASDYKFLVAEVASRVAGYACLSSIACTLSSWDLHWIAVSPEQQGLGVGRKLLAASEELARSHGATRMYLDTSGRAQYVPTRAFYERCGYEVAGTLPDFYAPGDSKVVFLKVL